MSLDLNDIANLTLAISQLKSALSRLDHLGFSVAAAFIDNAICVVQDELGENESINDDAILKLEFDSDEKFRLIDEFVERFFADKLAPGFVENERNL